MIDPPKILVSPLVHTAVIPVTVPRAEIRSVMGPGVRELFGALAEAGVKPAGAWFTHHLRFPPDVFDFEIGVPVSAAIAPVGRVRPGTLPSERVARTVHHGGYEALPAAWAELDAWIRAQGQAPREDLWEVYSVGPESSPDAANYRTELSRPLAG